MPTKRSVDFLKQIAEYMAKSSSFDRVLQKLKVTGGGGGTCIAEFTIGKEHLNASGSLHGGLISTILDNITTYALMSKPCHPGVTVDLQVRYIRTVAKEGDEIVVEANTIRAGKTLAYVECELRRKNDGSVIVKGAQTKYVAFD